MLNTKDEIDNPSLLIQASLRRKHQAKQVKKGEHSIACHKSRQIGFQKYSPSEQKSTSQVFFPVAQEDVWRGQCVCSSQYSPL